MFFYLLNFIIKFLLIVVSILLSVAYFTLAERKVMATIQRRKGPNVVGVFGLTQPLADGLKLIIKEFLFPRKADLAVFIIAPILTFALSLVVWSVIPFGPGYVYSDLSLGLLFLFAVSSLGVYGIIMSGWSSNSKYAFLGALRSAAQLVSYEVCIGFVLISVILCTGSLNLSVIVEAQFLAWYACFLLPMFIIFFISCLAETNRHPFDLPEAESELVAGYNVEYSGVGFALFFLGEYSNILLACSLLSILFLGGWTFFGFESPFFLGIKVVLGVILFVWVRAAYPRYRYDQLMRLGWKVFLPLSMGWVLFVSGFLIGMNGLPY